MLNIKTIFHAMNTDQLYKIGILLASYDLIEQMNVLKSYIDEVYGVISSDYMQNLIDCEKLGQEFPKALRTKLIIEGLDKQTVEMCAIMPIDFFLEIEEAMIHDENITFQQFEELNRIKRIFLELDRGALVS